MPAAAGLELPSAICNDSSAILASGPVSFPLAFSLTERSRARTNSVTSRYSSRSAGAGATDSVRAQRRVNWRPTVLRRLRTITSASSACSSSTLRGVSLSRRSTKWLWNRLAVLSRPGSSRVTRLNSSSRLFCTGVAVSSRMNCLRNAPANFQACVVRFRRWWASSTMTMSQVRARIAVRCGSRLAVWIEAITRSNVAPGVRPLLAEGRVVVAGQLDRELAPHLPLPLLDQRRGNQHQDRADQPAHRQLGQDQPGLDRLAQADLVAQQGAAAEPPEHGLGRADLVLQRLDVAHQRQRDQPVEPGVQRQPGRPQRQVELP